MLYEKDRIIVWVDGYDVSEMVDYLNRLGVTPSKIENTMSMLESLQHSSVSAVYLRVIDEVFTTDNETITTVFIDYYA